MMPNVRLLYARVAALAATAPSILVLPGTAELMQHVAEVRLGMYATGGQLDPHAQAIRLGFGAVKILALLLTVFAALRYWRMGSFARALRPGRGFFVGVAIVVVVQLGSEAVALALGGMLAKAIPAGAGHRLLAVLPLLGWLIVSCLLQPWYVGLVTGDRAMTLGRSAAGIAPRLPASFGLLLAGVLPLMIAHYALGYAAMRASTGLVWLLMVVDAPVVAFLALSIASAYYALYECAAIASGHTQAMSGVPSAITSTDKGSPSRQ